MRARTRGKESESKCKREEAKERNRQIGREVECVRACMRARKEKRRNRVAIKRPSSFSLDISLLFRHTSKKNLRHRSVALKHTESSNVRKFVAGELKNKLKKKRKDSAIDGFGGRFDRINHNQCDRKPFVDVCASVVCTFSSYYVLGLGPVRPSCLSPLPPLFTELRFFDSSFPVFLSFHRCHSFIRKVRTLFIRQCSYLRGHYE